MDGFPEDPLLVNHQLLWAWDEGAKDQSRGSLMIPFWFDCPIIRLFAGSICAFNLSHQIPIWSNTSHNHLNRSAPRCRSFVQGIKLGTWRWDLPLRCMKENRSSKNSFRFGSSLISYNWRRNKAEKDTLVNLTRNWFHISEINSGTRVAHKTFIHYIEVHTLHPHILASLHNNNNKSAQNKVCEQNPQSVPTCMCVCLFNFLSNDDDWLDSPWE